jgi:hypothetical protein
MMEVKIKYATEFGISETLIEINDLKSWIDKYNFKIYSIEEKNTSYSKEEVLSILESLVEHPTKPGYKRRNIVKFIEQFKTK